MAIKNRPIQKSVLQKRYRGAAVNETGKSLERPPIIRSRPKIVKITKASPVNCRVLFLILCWLSCGSAAVAASTRPPAPDHSANPDDSIRWWNDLSGHQAKTA